MKSPSRQQVLPAALPLPCASTPPRRHCRLFCRLLPVFFVLVLASCAARQEQAVPDDPYAAQAWQRFEERCRAAETDGKPFRVSASLRYTGQKGQGTRLSALLWGNGNPGSPYPLRLDLLAGLGSAVAKIREDEQTFLAYSPDEKTAYTQTRGNRTLLSFGVPIPMTLGDLTLLITGHPGRVFLPGVKGASAMPKEFGHSEHGTLYALAGAALPGYLELSLDGVPLSWRQKPAAGWQMTFDPGEADPLRPRRITISHPEGYSALVVIRNTEFPPVPFTPEQMDLILPPGTAQKTLKP